jgi:hypothetical protein
MCDHAKRVMGRLQHRDAMLNKEVIELKAKLEIEAIRYDMQVKVSKTTSHLLAFSWIFFVVFVSVFWGQYHVQDICTTNGYHETKWLVYL